MVTDQIVCSRIASQWNDEGLFDSKWANLVGRWCIEHIRKFDRPIGKSIKGVFEEWEQRSGVEKATADGIGRFLEYLSDDWESQGEVASDCILDIAGKYFSRVKARKAIDAATDLLDSNRPEEAISIMANIGRVELGAGSLVKPVEEFDIWQQAFDPERRAPIVHYSDGLGKFFGDVLARDTLIAFMAPDKVGKSFWLLDIAFRALKGRRRVAYFEAGDLLQDEVLLRLGSRSAYRPVRSGKIHVPISLDKDSFEVEYDDRIFKDGLSSREAFRSFSKLCRGRDCFRLSCHPNSTVSVEQIHSILMDWNREGWIADVVVIDYADILAPPYGSRDVLDSVDETWKRLRRLSQEFHCLVVTASQSNAAAYTDKSSILSRKHFSGRKTKLAHVNGMIGINYNEDDKKKGIMRLNWVVRRNARYSEKKTVAVAGCLAVAAPSIISVY